MSFVDIFPRCDISVRVFVRSTSESRPSSTESRMTESFFSGTFSLVGEVDSTGAIWGARNESAGCCGPK